MRYYILIILFAIFFASCKNESIDSDKIDDTHKIKIDLDNLKNESLPSLEIQSVVHLETSDSSLIGEISCLEFHNRNIYILDEFKSKALFAFSDEGLFINKTKNGSGPGEVNYPTAFYVDTNSDIIYLKENRSRSMLKYTVDLEYIDQEKFNPILLDFAVLDNDRILIHTHYYDDFTYKIVGTDNETIEHSFIPDISYSGALGIGRAISTNKRILLITPYDYNIYQLEDNNVKSKYYIDFGEYKLTKDIIEQRGMRGARILNQQGKRVSSLADISEGENFLSFRVYFRSSNLYYVYSLINNKCYLLNEYFDKNMLPLCKVRGIAEDDVFYAFIQPGNLDNFQKTTGNKLVDGEIDDNSNPYIITFTLEE